MAERSKEQLVDPSNGTPERPVALGRYDVVGRLGKGGMGTVYEARDRERGTTVALKTLSVADPAAAVRLKREFRFVADMAHPNLAPVYELAEVGGLWFFTMERVDGVSFSQWSRREVPAQEMPPQFSMSRTLQTTVLADVPTECESVEPESVEAFDEVLASPPRRPIEQIRRALVELVSGVSALHEVGLFHGDLKPANVLVRADGRVVVVDFGLSGNVGRDEQVSEFVAGTPMYMPPEQLCGVVTGGPSTDWYALGVLLYRVLTGRFPWAQQSLLDLLFNKRHHEPRPPAAMLDVPADLSELCMALVDPDPERRPGTDEILSVLTGSAPSPASSSIRSGRRPGVYFVGRERELCDLERAYGSARGGRMVLVHTHGTSGIGKSALLESFVRGVQDLDGALLLRGRCYERENVPYKAFDRIVDELAEYLQSVSLDDVEKLLPDWTAELATVFPALRSVENVRHRLEQTQLPADAMELRRRAWAALSELLGTLRRDRPVVVAIDDLQWADADSAQLLVELIGGPRPPALLLVVSYRPEAAANAVLEPYFEKTAQLATDGALVDLALDALRPSEARQLARAALERIGAPASDDRVDYVAKEAGGMPFFIEELANFVATVGERDLDDGITLDQAIRARIGGLPDSQRALIETVAVAGSPLPQSLMFEAAGVDADDLPVLLALRGASLVSWLGAGGDDAVSTYHDRIRESVVAALDEAKRQTVHLALGRALARRHARAPSGSWVFEALRHLGAAGGLLEDADERLAVARLSLEAARRARSAAAFPLAFRCFEDGLKLLPEDAWDRHYDLALALHVGAAETAYLSAEWEALDRRVDEVKAHAKTAMDQMPVWEVCVDAHAGKQEYAASVDAGIRALSLLGVHLPSDPGEAEVGAAVQQALEQLTAIGPDAFVRLDDVSDPEMLAAMRIGVRVSPAAYFNRPLLLPVIASHLIRMSIDKGLSNATPYALALFGIVLNTLEMFPVSHRWGRLALRLLNRYPDRSLEAATRHVLNNLVCNWMVPLSSTLDDLREVFDIGCRTGDYEYASYAAHGYVHNAIYAGRPLEPLLAEALDLGEQMSALGAVNALHVHTPFEQLLKALTGKLEHPWCLNDASFDEGTSLAEAEAAGSRSGMFVNHYVPGLVRYAFGRPAEAAHRFDRAREYQDAVPSIWHNPVLAQFSVLAACARLEVTEDEAERARLREVVETSLALLERLAGHHAGNFAHRVSLARGERHRIEGDRVAALAAFEKAVQQAGEGGWINDIALAHELAARCYDDPSEVRRAYRAARAAYAAWGATAKVEELQARLEALD